MEKKLSVLELIKEEAKEEEAKTTETKEKKELKQKVKNAFFLIQKIKGLNGYYCKTHNRNNFKIFHPKNTSNILTFLDNGETTLYITKNSNPPQKQKVLINHLRNLEPTLIKAQIGYMPFLEYKNGFL